MTSPARDSTADALFDGTMALHQPARGQGYRVNVDAVLLAWFAGQERRAKRAVDLGAGVGAVGLSLLYRDRAGEVLFVERERALSTLCERNLEANAWSARGRAQLADVATLTAEHVGAGVDLVVCNPPYVEAGRGRPARVAAEARIGELSVFTEAARRALGRRGRACFVYPTLELATLFEMLRASSLEPKRVCFVHASASDPARVALVEAMPAKRGGLVILPPLVERDAHGPSLTLRTILAATCGSPAYVAASRAP